MRVVAVVHFYVPVHMAGSETMLHAMLAALVAAGHDVHVVVTREANHRDDVVDGVHVHRRMGHAADAKIQHLQPDIIVTHHAEVHRAKRAADRHRSRLIHLLHSDAQIACRATALQRPDLVVFNTNWVRDAFRTSWGLERDGMVLHPPIDPARHLVTPGSKVTLVNLSEAKGALVFYELARLMPDVEFLGVIGGYDEQLIEDLPNVEIHPHTPDPRTFWAKTRILLVPSAHESFGMVSIEAALSGIPAIAHPTPGLREALAHAGRFEHRAMVGDWQQAIRDLLDPTVWAEASAKAKARAAEFDTEGGLRRWVQAVEQL